MATLNSKRKIGGHFGATIGSSTKRQRASWREETDAPEPVAAKASGGPQDADGSDSDAVEDPGTPLPSEDENEEKLDAVADPTSVVANGETNGVGGATPAENGGEAAPSVAMQSEVSSGLAAAAPTPVVVTMDLVIGDEAKADDTLAQMRLLFPDGLGDAERRLSAALAPSGGRVEAIVDGGLCMFAGHLPLPTSERNALARDLASAARNQLASLDKVNGHGNGDAGVATNGNGKAHPQHSCAGLLVAPRDGPGLALTLGGPLPSLDATHVVLGTVVSGTKLVRRLLAQASVCPALDGEPRDVPHRSVFLRCRGPASDAASIGEQKGIKHSFLQLEAASGDTRAARPFADDVEVVGVDPDEVEVASMELDTRDFEYARLKDQPFCRERAEGVTAMEDALEAIIAQLEVWATATGAPVKTDDAAADVAADASAAVAPVSAVAGQCGWLQERARHMLRMLKKLR